LHEFINRLHNIEAGRTIIDLFNFDSLNAAVLYIINIQMVMKLYTLKINCPIIRNY